MSALSVLERQQRCIKTKAWNVKTRISAPAAGMMAIMGRGQGWPTQLQQCNPIGINNPTVGAASAAIALLDCCANRG